MSLQKIQGFATQDKEQRLGITWSVFNDSHKGILVAVATDGDFTQNYRVFLLPPSATSCGLDLGGQGQLPWFFRLGTLLPNGTLEWSGIYGPIVLSSSKLVTQSPETIVHIIHTQPITDGLRLHTNLSTPYYTIIEYTKNKLFKASETTYKWVYTTNSHVDVMGLEHPYNTGYMPLSTGPLRSDPLHQQKQIDMPYSYTIRISSVKEIPTDTIVPLGIWQTIRGKLPLAPKQRLTVDTATSAVDKVILKDMAERPLRFTSQEEYAKYLAAKARNEGRKY